MTQRFSRYLLKKWGWTYNDDLPAENRCILLGVPHTSILDFVVSYLYYKAIGGQALCMVKKSLFFPPLGWILRAMGGIPVDRSNSGALVRSLIRQMNEKETFHLAIAPEGTRKPVKRWKTGYHLIAREAGVPVYLGYFDWKRKRVGRGQKVELTDDANADTRRIQALYEAMDLGARHQDQYLTH